MTARDAAERAASGGSYGGDPPPPWVQATPYLAAPVSGAYAFALARHTDEALQRVRAAAALDPAVRAELPGAERQAEAVRHAARVWRQARMSASGRADMASADIATHSAATADVRPPGQREIDVPAAAGLLRLSTRHVRRLAAAGTIPARKVGRTWLIERDALELEEVA